eukprot:1981333-Heterocapsa_arctica.AAC.1
MPGRMASKAGLDRAGAGMLAGKRAPYLERGQLHMLSLVYILEKDNFPQDWGAPHVHWCALLSARLKEVAVLLHEP